MTTMAANEPPGILKLIAHEVRWRLLKLLVLSDRRVQELVMLVDEPMNLVSYHLRQLRDGGVVTIRRSEADARDIYYSLDVGALRDLYLTAGAALHPALGGEELTWLAPSHAKRVLFVCTHNSARSQMAEALMRSLSDGKVDVTSAGNQPTSLHPDAVEAMDSFGIDIRHQQSKSLQSVDGRAFDTVITVCDRAREVCPVFPGDGDQIHWGFPDPAAIPDRDERQRVFRLIAEQLKARIEFFLLRPASAR